MNSLNTISLDVVIPVYNEQEVVGILLPELSRVFDAASRERLGVKSVRIIFVDDGSTDDTIRHIEKHYTPAAGLEVQIIRLSRNWGHQPAISAGLSKADADAVVIMDADMQDPPSLIHEMIHKYREGYDVVYAVRKSRKENLIKRMAYWLFYRLYRSMVEIPVPLDSGDFCMMSRRVVQDINRLPESIRFMRGLRAWIGYRQAGIEYERPARIAGTTKYSFRRLYELATNGIAGMSIRPLQFAQLVCFVSIVLTFAAMIAFAVLLVVGRVHQPLLWITLITVLGSNSALFFCMYILGAYLGRGYLETKNRPSYIISDIVRCEHE